MSGRDLWLRSGVSVALAGVLTALADPARPAGTMPRTAAVATALAAGILLFSILERRRPAARPRTPHVRPLTGGVLVVLAAAEEVTWRWFVLGELLGRAGPAGALAASSALFALAHRASRGRQLATGAAFGGVYLATGSVVASAAAHAAYNLCAADARRSRASPAGKAAA